MGFSNIDHNEIPEKDWRITIIAACVFLIAVCEVFSALVTLGRM